MKSDQVNLNIFYGFKCNYSCDGCISNSNLVKSDQDPDLNDIIKTIPILSNLFNVTGMITLLGGEPFYYWDDRIVPIATECNKYFPNTLINIFTNGQLLKKNQEKVFALSEKINKFSLTITDHLNTNELKNTTPGKSWKKSTDGFFNNKRLVKIHDAHYHIKDNINGNIYISAPNANNWQNIYKTTIDGKIKPFATNDPEGSMKYGCVSNSICSMVQGTKLYKCTQLATLENALRVKNQLDDPDWQKYLSYTPVDLLNINESILTNFINTYDKPIDTCDMCSNNPVAGKPRLYNMIFKN
jgi:organic radical activating enzyme